MLQWEISAVRISADSKSEYVRKGCVMSSGCSQKHRFPAGQHWCCYPRSESLVRARALHLWHGFLQQLSGRQRQRCCQAPALWSTLEQEAWRICWVSVGCCPGSCSKPSGSSLLISAAARWDPELAPAPGDSRATAGAAGRDLDRTRRWLIRHGLWALGGGGGAVKTVALVTARSVQKAGALLGSPLCTRRVRAECLAVLTSISIPRAVPRAEQGPPEGRVLFLEPGALKPLLVPAALGSVVGALEEQFAPLPAQLSLRNPDAAGAAVPAWGRGARSHRHVSPGAFHESPRVSRQAACFSSPSDSRRNFLLRLCILFCRRLCFPIFIPKVTNHIFELWC